MAILLDSDAEIPDGFVTGIILPDDLSNGLVGYFEHQDTIARAVRNLVDADNPAVAIGSPTMAADGMSCTPNSHYLQTAIMETASFTWMTVSRPTETITTSGGGFPLIASLNTQGAALTIRGQSGGGAQPDPAGLTTSFTYTGGTSKSNTFTQAAATGWHCRAQRVRSGVDRKSYDLTTGESNSANDTAARNVSANPILIGSLWTTAYTRHTKHLRTLLWNRGLSDAEISAAHAFVAAEVLLVDAGIVV